jgi:hypothetical protein
MQTWIWSLTVTDLRAIYKRARGKNIRLARACYERLMVENSWR